MTGPHEVALQGTRSDSTQPETYVHVPQPHAGAPGSEVGTSGTGENKPSLSPQHSTPHPPCQTSKSTSHLPLGHHGNRHPPSCEQARSPWSWAPWPQVPQAPPGQQGGEGERARRGTWGEEERGYTEAGREQKKRGRGRSNRAGRGPLLPPLLHTFLRLELLSAPAGGILAAQPGLPAPGSWQPTVPLRPQLLLQPLQAPRAEGWGPILQGRRGPFSHT